MLGEGVCAYWSVKLSVYSGASLCTSPELGLTKVEWQRSTVSCFKLALFFSFQSRAHSKMVRQQLFSCSRKAGACLDSGISVLPLSVRSVWSSSAKHQDRGRRGGPCGQLALAGQRAFLRGSPLRRLPHQQPVGAVCCPLRLRVRVRGEEPSKGRGLD